MKRIGLLAIAALLAVPAQAADTRISDIPLASSLSGAETLPIILQDNLTMRRATMSQIAAMTAWNQWRGTWSAATSYVLNDAITYNGTSYIAIAPSLNQPPPNAAYWNVLAQKGTDGNGNGTVTSITAGTGLSGGVITSTGTLSLTAPVTVALGGTGVTSASGTALDNITGFASTGFLKRTGSGTYTFVPDPIPVANGGTGLGSGSVGGVPCYTGTTTMASSAALTANALVLGGGAACPSVVASTGATTTVLHGNASGAPSFTAVQYADLDPTTIASGTTIDNNTPNKLVTTGSLWAAPLVVALTDGATVNVDLSTGINFSVTLAGNRALGNPTGAKVGQSGVIRVAQDATGSRTLSYGTSYKWASGTACVMSTGASKVDYLFYFVYSSTEVLLSCTLDVR